MKLPLHLHRMRPEEEEEEQAENSSISIDRPDQFDPSLQQEMLSIFSEEMERIRVAEIPKELASKAEAAGIPTDWTSKLAGKWLCIHYNKNYMRIHELEEDGKGGLLQRSRGSRRARVEKDEEDESPVVVPIRLRDTGDITWGKGDVILDKSTIGSRTIVWTHRNGHRWEWRRYVPPPEAKTNSPPEVQAEKFVGRFLVGIESDQAFNVVGRIIGRRGRKVKSIAYSTGSKCRLLGTGSGYVESSGREFAGPLQLHISSKNPKGFCQATQLVREVLTQVHQEYKEFCQSNGRPEPELHIELEQRHKQARILKAVMGAESSGTSENNT